MAVGWTPDQGVAERDPMGQPRAVFEEVYARIARRMREVERAIG
jgi:hypothetical protein